jgi:hypothetical protein
MLNFPRRGIDTRDVRAELVAADDVELRELVPQVLSVLVRRGADFATARTRCRRHLSGQSRHGRKSCPPIPRAG